jgi:hypothetical protein
MSLNLSILHEVNKYSQNIFSELSREPSPQRIFTYLVDLLRTTGPIILVLSSDSILLEINMEKGQDSKTGLPASAPSVDSYPITQISNDESCPDQHTMAATQRSSIKRNNSYSFKNLQSNDPIHLSAYENQVLERQLSMPSIKVSYMMLYRYATKIDILTLIISSICAMASGVVLPLMTVSTLSQTELVCSITAKFL